MSESESPLNELDCKCSIMDGEALLMSYGCEGVWNKIDFKGGS